MCMCMCMYVAPVDEKSSMNFKESKGGYMGDFGGRKGKGEITYLYYNLKNKRNNQFT